jgi:hypothetical protein
VAVSSDSTLQFNPGTNVLTTDVFSGNFTGTAATATNFFGTLTGNVTGNLTGTATTAQNVNLAAGANNSNHSVVFSLNATGTGVGLSSDAGLQYNPSTNVLTADVFSGNFTGTAVTATNFFGTFQGSSATAVTSQNINVVAATTAATHFITFSPASSGSGLATSADTDLTYNPSTNVLSAGVFSGNFTGTAATATKAITGAFTDSQNAARLTAAGGGGFTDSQNAARLAAQGGITINVNAPSIIDEEAFSRATTNALNNSSFRGTNGANNLVFL